MTTITSETDASLQKKSGSLLRLFRTYFRGHLVWFIAGTVFAVLTSAFATGYALILGVMGDRLEATFSASTDADNRWILWVAAGIIALTAGRALTLYLMTVLNNTGVQRSLVDVQNAQFNALTRGDYARVAGKASGGFVSRFINDVNSIRDAGLRFANNFTKSLVTIVAILAVMLWTDWLLTLLLLIVYPIASGPVIGLGNRIRKRSKQAQQQIGEVSALLSEGFQSARVVKAYSLEDYQSERADRGFVERSRLFLKVLKDRAAVDPILEVTGGIALAGVLGFAAWRISNDAATLGDLLRIIAGLAIASPELRALGTLNAVAQEGGAAADRVFEIIDAVPQVSDTEGARAPSHVIGAVSFSDVYFHYPDDTPALKGLTFSVQPGETVALVGPSGAGKSTVFNLLLRLYDVSAGSVFVDAIDVRKLRSASLRGATALVSQDTALFDDTIRANIALGLLDASDAEIEAAAKAANADTFIAELPDGYASPAGEFGRNLSGGQRQRIALARAILRDAPILLLDEATSALDAESEAKVQAALAGFAKDRTTLIIAHRLSTVRGADRIIVIEDGRVVEDGDHQTLMAAQGSYQKLVELQLS